jgi:hypothetical protein
MRKIIDRQPRINHAAQAADEIVGAMNAQFEQVVQTHRSGFERFWRSYAATPDEIAEELGDQGARMMVAAGASAQFIRGLAQALGLDLADYIEESDLVPPRPVTLNEDGTITIGE